MAKEVNVRNLKIHMLPLNEMKEILVIITNIFIVIYNVKQSRFITRPVNFLLPISLRKFYSFKPNS